MARLLLLQAVIIYIWLMFPAQAKADDKFWFSNRIEFGYDNIFMRESFTVRAGQITRNRVSFGLNFKLSEKISYRTFYLLKNSLKNEWHPDHQLGAQLNFKLQ